MSENIDTTDLIGVLHQEITDSLPDEAVQPLGELVVLEPGLVGGPVAGRAGGWRIGCRISHGCKSFTWNTSTPTLSQSG